MKPDSARTLLHAYIDGELDAASTIELKEEIDRSPGLQQELARLSALQTALRGGTRFSAPAGLTERAFASVSAPSETIRNNVSPLWRTGGLAASAVAAALLLWILGAPSFPSQRSASSIDEVVSAHIRSLLADHLTDLASAERHAVKPWLSNRLDFAPPVRDFSAQGFSLVGGRLDYLGGKAVAAIVYQHRQHVINVFVWPSADQSSSSIRETGERGFNAVQFSANGMNYWAVSDVNNQDLRKLADLLVSQ